MPIGNNETTSRDSLGDVVLRSAEAITEMILPGGFHNPHGSFYGWKAPMWETKVMSVKSCEKDGRLEMPLSSPLKILWRGMEQWNRWWITWRWRRWTSGDIGVDHPLLCHQRPAVLSVQYSVVCSHMSKQSSIHVWCITLPSRSRVMLMTWPSGLLQETIWDGMSAGKCSHHTMVCTPADPGTWLQCWDAVGGYWEP